MLAFALGGCGDESPTATHPNTSDPELPPALAEVLLRLDPLDELRAFAADPAGAPDALGRISLRVVRVPAGSHDALVAAIVSAGTGGTVIVESGDHFESQTVMVEHRVRIVGEPGAVIRSGIAPDLDLTTVELEPVFHVRGVPNVVIWGLTIEPVASIGNSAILLENAARAWIAHNTMRNFAYTLGVEGSDHVRIWKNVIESTPAWMDGTIPEAMGITVYTGRYCTVVENEISQSLFGLWACDVRGQAVANEFYGNYLGLILCKVPEQAYYLPDGRNIFATAPATQWLSVGNDSHDNFAYGYLGIDGATENILFDNAAANNGEYDIELTGDTFRFGFFTPRSSNTLVVAGQHAELVVKDCGDDNQVIGFDAIVDNGADPCN